MACLRQQSTDMSIAGDDAGASNGLFNDSMTTSHYVGKVEDFPAPGKMQEIDEIYCLGA